MNTQNAKSRQKILKKETIKEDGFYYLISTHQPTLLNICLFLAVFCSYAYSISCKFG